MKRILFLCTGNSCRSQMAEGWGKALKSDSFQFFSAGTACHGMNPNAIKVMKEVGVDISAQTSKTLADIQTTEMDYVFTVCADAHESCPTIPGVKVIHTSFDDPPRLAAFEKSKEKQLDIYRKVRDDIKSMVCNIAQIIDESPKNN